MPLLRIHISHRRRVQIPQKAARCRHRLRQRKEKNLRVLRQSVSVPHEHVEASEKAQRSSTDLQLLQFQTYQPQRTLQTHGTGALALEDVHLFPLRQGVLQKSQPTPARPGPFWGEKTHLRDLRHVFRPQRELVGTPETPHGGATLHLQFLRQGFHPTVGAAIARGWTLRSPRPRLSGMRGRV